MLKAAAIPEYAELLRSAVSLSKGDVDLACDRFAVSVGCGLPGYVTHAPHTGQGH